MQKASARADVLAELTWSLDDLFASQAQWDAELTALDAALPTVQPFQGRLGDNAATLLACLDAVEQLEQRFMRVATFAHLRNAEDGTNPAHQAASARVAALGAPACAATPGPRSAPG
jgi:oligoendopeptidase F